MKVLYWEGDRCITHREIDYEIKVVDKCPHYHYEHYYHGDARFPTTEKWCRLNHGLKFEDFQEDYIYQTRCKDCPLPDKENK